MKLSRYEQEVMINFNADEDTATLYTADPVWRRKMDKLAEQNPIDFQCIRVMKSVKHIHSLNVCYV